MDKSSQTITSKDLAKALNGVLIGKDDLFLKGVADLNSAQEGDISFFHNEKYRSQLQRTQASLVITAQRVTDREDLTWILCEQPSLAFQKAIEMFCPAPNTRPYLGIHPTAIIDPTATLGKDVTLGPYVVVGPGSIIGDRSYLSPHCVLGSQVQVGVDCYFHPSVVVRESSVIGNRVILQPNVVIGSCGFGYDTKAGKHTKLEQLGHVVIEDDVEIGAGSTIDRARFQITRIGAGTKIDNLVMIAHGVTLGKDNLIVAQAGLAGSTKTGRWVVIGGQAGVAGHIELSDGVMVAAQSGVSKNLSSGTYGGMPAQPIKDWHRDQAHVHMIGKLKEQIKAIEHKLQEIENKNISSGSGS